jgi:pimeloyl-ACP methyl ester carboxylesterase
MMQWNPMLQPIMATEPVSSSLVSSFPGSGHSRWRSLSTAAVRGVLALFLAMVVVPEAVHAQGELAAPRPETLITKDNITLHATYYKSNKGKDASVIVCLHERQGLRYVWQTKNGLAEQLHKAGFAVLTVDLRGHGESRGDSPAAIPANANQAAKPGKKDTKKDTKKPGKSEGGDLKPADYGNMVLLDMEAVKKFIFERHQAEELNMSKLGIVGIEMGASVGTAFAAIDWLREPYPDGVGAARTPRGQDVRAVAMISPQVNLPGLPLTKPLAELKTPAINVAFFIGTSKADSKDKGQAKKLFDQVSQGQPENTPDAEKRMYFYEFPGGLHGAQLLGQQRIALEGLLTAFFIKHIDKRDIPWRDRRSKLNREE